MRVLWILILLAAGCGLAAEVVKEDAETIAYRQPDGSVVTLHKQPKRVVICYASLVPVWYAAGGSAVGVPRVASADAMTPEILRDIFEIESSIHTGADGVPCCIPTGSVKEPTR